MGVVRGVRLVPLMTWHTMRRQAAYTHVLASLPIAIMAHVRCRWGVLSDCRSCHHTSGMMSACRCPSGTYPSAIVFAALPVQSLHAGISSIAVFAACVRDGC